MFSSLYIGASGMKTHAEGMQVLGNNIANVNTVGFKSSQAHFSNLMSQDVVEADTAANVGNSQVGMGVTLGDVKTSFAQGALEQSNQMSDMGITGVGFFGVEKDNVTRYTRAGNFLMDKDGYMVDPHGYVLQGQSLTGSSAGTSGDIRFEPNDQGLVVMDPKATTSVSLMSNLGGGDNTPGTGAPFFSLASIWDGGSETPLSPTTYSYADSIKTYDDEGNSHELTTYFDEVEVSDANGAKHFEFVIGMDPAEDGRTGFSGASAAGMLMIGTLSFDSSGTLQNMSAFTNDGSGSKALSNWSPSSFDTSGQPQFNVTYANGQSTTIGIDFGLSNNGSGWNNSVANAAAVGLNASALPRFDATREATSTTAYEGSSSTLYSSQDGYEEGYMLDYAVHTDGIIEGNFTNGQNQEMYRVNLYNFANPYGLSHEGDNHFGATKASGEARQGFAEEEEFGSIAQYATEQSNVDLAREFVHMINNQRGFQANSKIITTSDSVLQNALNIKR